MYMYIKHHQTNNTTKKQIMPNEHKCAEQAKILFNGIWLRIGSWGIFTNDFPDGGFSFRLYWANPDYAISVSIPPDNNPNPNPDHWIYETALWSVKKNRVLHSDNFDYNQDVIKFETPEEVIDEIFRVALLTLKPSMV